MGKNILLINDLAGYGKVALSAILTGKMLDGCSLRASTAKAMDAVRELIIRNRGNEDKFKGIPVESCLEVIDG